MTFRLASGLSKHLVDYRLDSTNFMVPDIAKNVLWLQHSTLLRRGALPALASLRCPCLSEISSKLRPKSASGLLSTVPSLSAPSLMRPERSQLHHGKWHIPNLMLIIMASLDACAGVACIMHVISAISATKISLQQHTGW